MRILETTDLHVHLFPYDYYADRPVDTVGLSRTASLINAVRAEAANSMLVDNGDFLQGNPMGDYIAYERGMKDGDMHPVITALNDLNFDAATLGNHEFNYGLDFLMKSIVGAAFPLLSANVILQRGGTPTGDKTLVKPYAILDRTLRDGTGKQHPIKIGLIGFVPPQIMVWDRQHLEGNVTTRDILETARAYIPEMKESGADVIIALSHSGIGSATHTDGMEHASVPLAKVDGIDALMTGHSHLVFPDPMFKGMAGVDIERGTLHGKPAAMGGFWGSHLGIIDLLLERDAGEWRVINHASQARPIYQRDQKNGVTALAGDDPIVLNAVEKEHKETLAYIRRPVGKTNTPLHSYFALLGHAPSVQIVSNAQSWYLRKLLKGSPLYDLPILSAVAPYKAGGRAGPEYFTDVPAGDIAIKNVADLYLFPNTVRAVRITGAQVKEWLERAAGMFNQIVAGGRDSQLLNPAFSSYNFDTIAGVTYQIDLSQPLKYHPHTGEVLDPSANRIVNLMWNNRSIDPAQEFIVATNSYRAEGGGGFPGADGSTIMFEAPDTVRDVVVRYIVEHGTIDLVEDKNWGFAPLPDTTILFETGPKARKYSANVTSVALEDAGDTAEGFACFRVTL